MPNTPGAPDELDVLVVGAGFSGLHQLQLYRKLGYKVKVLEAGSDIGGTWYWNRYPGARVDSHVPIYEFSDESLWKDWNWTEKFPGWQELQAYFQYVDQKLGLKKDITFNTRVISAEWNEGGNRWVVKTDDGREVHPRFLVLATGGLSIPYTPAFKGLEKFEGVCHHTARWPEEGVDVKGKRVAVVGTGCSGVQVIQEIGPEVGHLTVFQRTPNLCLPMRQAKLDRATQEAQKKSLYPILYNRRPQTGTGFVYVANPTEYSKATPEERTLRMEETWALGGFTPSWTFPDTIINQETNDAMYAFWRSKVRERLRDPRMQEKLAPIVPPHPFGCQRPSFEQTYYEVYNQDNVTLVDLNENPIGEFTRKGVVTGDGQEHEFDVVVLATGFDAITGAMKSINLRGVEGKTIADHWKDGVYTNLGMTMSGFPNLFFTYGPQAPTAFTNGPSFIEPQSKWISECIQHMNENNLTRIEATREAEEAWKGLVASIFDMTLMKKGKSWWTGANIPGKPVESLNFPGGMPLYFQLCAEKVEKGYEESGNVLEILRFPTELVIHILSFLPVSDIIRFSLTSRLSREILTSSPALTYIQHLHLYKAVDNAESLLSHAEKLTLLKRQRDAWLRCEPTFFTKVPIDFTEASIYDLSSGTYFLGAVDRRTLKYLDLPRKPGDDMVWKIFRPVGQNARIIDFASNRYEHDMICLVTGERDTVDQLFSRVHIKLAIYQFSTGEPHPFAKQHVLQLTGPDSEWGAPAVYCEIAGEHIALVTNFRRGVLAPCVNVFHWKTGQIVMRKYGSDTYEGVVFLDENTILLPQLSDDVLEIWKIPPLGEPAPKYPVCSLRLFPVSLGSAIQYVSCRSDPNPNTEGATLRTRSSFHASADDGIVLLHVWIRSGMLMDNASLVTLIVHRKALLQLRTTAWSSDGSPSTTPWSEWAPSISICFHGNGSTMTRWITEASAQRFVWLHRDEDAADNPEGPSHPATVVVYDFDQDLVKMVEREAEQDTEEQCQQRNVYGPIVRRGPHRLPQDMQPIFTEEIATYLPYVESRTKEKYDFDSAMLDQERVVGLKASKCPFEIWLVL